MCDTFVALGNSTKDGSVIFGKNSDREPNEAHKLNLVPHAQHKKGAKVACTYIEIPQVPETNAVLLSKPFWIWGAEMGANEHDVVIGNEAVFTKVPYDKEPGLIGMDFLRLGLERAASADEALDVIIDLLEQYGQGGNCGFANKLYYHNSFLIADQASAWVLETAGKHWAAEKVQDIRAISNIISIGSRWERASDDLVAFAIEKGWCQDENDFDFKRCYSDLIYTRFAAGEHRSCRVTDLLKEKIGDIDVPYAMRVLRDHGPDADENWLPARGLTGAEVCMHASFGPVRVSQTTGSMVSHLKPGCSTHWLTGTAAPCTSIFKPVWMDSGLPVLGPVPDGIYDESVRWWRHENLHREILRDYSIRIQSVKNKQRELEKDFLCKVEKNIGREKKVRYSITEDCFKKVEKEEAHLIKKIHKMPLNKRKPLVDKVAWFLFDRQSKRVHRT